MLPRIVRSSLSSLGGARLLAALVCALATWPPTSAMGGEKAGTRWFSGDLDAALAAGRKQNKRVLVKFEASWCGPCRRLGAQVFHSPEGARLTRDLIAVKVDFDAPANRKHIERYVVLGLPTTLVLDGEGRQVLRIMGYDGKADFERLLATASSATDPVPALEARLARAPGDDDARLALGKALLVRGRHGDAVHKRARALLEALLWRAPAGPKETDEARRQRSERAAEVLFVLGRYHHRVRRDPATAAHLWRELAARYPTTSWAGGAWWWYARSQAELGRPLVGAEALASRATSLPTRSALSQWIRFSAKHKLGGQQAKILAAIEAGKLSAKDKADLRAQATHLPK